ncbi:MAG: hypothetical protein R3F60_16260 [bacterium]
MRALSLSLIALALAACDDGPAATGDAATPDARVADAAPPDAAPADAAPADAAPADAAPADAAPADAAPPDAAGPYPDPGAWEPERGPGGPSVAFPEEALYQHCAYVDVGPDDIADHHNMVSMYDGYLVMPWSPEFGLTGGLTFFDFSDPCAPAIVGHATTNQMRESHTIGFSDQGGRFAVTAHQFNLTTGGALFWDVSDVTAPRVVSAIPVEGFFYPDAYARVILSTFGRRLLPSRGLDNGVRHHRTPRQPGGPERWSGSTSSSPSRRVGQVQVVGNLPVATAAEGTRAVSSTSAIRSSQPIPGGDFIAHDVGGVPKESGISPIFRGLLSGT